jgi:Terpene cyclase DEP1
MKPKTFYLLLCLLGTILPYLFLVPFLREHGLDLRRLFDDLFANRISSFFGMDVIVASICLWFFVYFEGRKSRVRHLWAPVVAS